MADIVVKIIRFVKAYYQLIRRACGLIFDPISKNIQIYSKTLSNTVKQIKKVSINTIALSPVIMFLVAVTIHAFGVNYSMDFDYDLMTQIFVPSIFIFSSIFVFTILGYVKNYNTKSTVFISILLLASGVLYNYVALYNKIVIVIASLYSLGGYISTLIEYENPYNHYYIYDELEPHNSISRIAYLSSILILFISYLSTELTADIQNYDYLIIILVSLVSYLVSYTQIPHYKDIYEHVDLNRSSRFWILTPQVLIILGSGFYISGSIGIALYTISLLSPCIFGIWFKSYIDGQVEGNNLSDKFSEDNHFYTTLTDSNHKTGKFNPEPNQKLDIQSEIDREQKSAIIEFKSTVEIPENFPTEYSDTPWIDMAEICESKRQLMLNMKGIDEEEIEEFREFYDEVLEYAACELYESDEENYIYYDEDLLNIITNKLHNVDNIKIGDIQETQLKYSRSISKSHIQKYEDT